MSRYREFCESLRAGQARAAEEQLQREDEEHALPSAVGQVLRRMCDHFQCPDGRAHYVDTRADVVTGQLVGAAPQLYYNPESCRRYLDLEMRVGDSPAVAGHRVWLHFEMVPLKRGGLEFYFGPERFQLPDEEKALFDRVADAINRELRAGYTPGPQRIGIA